MRGAEEGDPHYCGRDQDLPFWMQYHFLHVRVGTYVHIYSTDSSVIPYHSPIDAVCSIIVLDGYQRVSLTCP